MQESERPSGAFKLRKITHFLRTGSLFVTDEWRSFTSEDMPEDAPEVPVSVWWKIFRWMDCLNYAAEDEMSILFFDRLLAVRIRNGDTQYIVSDRPKFWLVVDELVDL